MHVRRRSLVAVLLLVSACVESDRGPALDKEEEEEGEEALSSGSCGVERWGVKTGTDSAASQVNLTAQGGPVVNYLQIDKNDINGASPGENPLAFDPGPGCCFAATLWYNRVW